MGSAHVSNGKENGEGNTKNGNRYLARAFVEAANFAVRYCEAARRFYQNKRAKRNSTVAIKAVAHKRALPHARRRALPGFPQPVRAWAASEPATSKEIRNIVRMVEAKN